MKDSFKINAILMGIAFIISVAFLAVSCIQTVHKVEIMEKTIEEEQGFLESAKKHRTLILIDTNDFVRQYSQTQNLEIKDEDLSQLNTSMSHEDSDYDIYYMQIMAVVHTYTEILEADAYIELSKKLKDANNAVHYHKTEYNKAVDQYYSYISSYPARSCLLVEKYEIKYYEKEMEKGEKDEIQTFKHESRH